MRAKRKAKTLLRADGLSEFTKGTLSSVSPNIPMESLGPNRSPFTLTRIRPPPLTLDSFLFLSLKQNREGDGAGAFMIEAEANRRLVSIEQREGRRE